MSLCKFVSKIIHIKKFQTEKEKNIFFNLRDRITSDLGENLLISPRIWQTCPTERTKITSCSILCTINLPTNSTQWEGGLPNLWEKIIKIFSGAVFVFFGLKIEGLQRIYNIYEVNKFYLLIHVLISFPNFKWFDESLYFIYIIFLARHV